MYLSCDFDKKQMTNNVSVIDGLNINVPKMMYVVLISIVSYLCIYKINLINIYRSVNRIKLKLHNRVNPHSQLS